MITSTTREGVQEFPDHKLDNHDVDNNGAGPSSNKTTNSSSLLRSKDPRIVRVSRAFGGKDRHSKVCTIRGLRDRRVRLSVPTAIQLYDLQDRLGLNQPSKVVDWLLNVAKDDIDELPPLQIPPGFNFIDQAHQAMLSSSSSSHAANHQVGATSTLLHADNQDLGSKINANWEEDDNNNAPIDSEKSSFWTSSQPRSTKFKQAIGTKEFVMNEKEIWTKEMDNNNDDDHKLETLELGHGGGGSGGMQLGSSSSFFPRSINHHSLPNFLHNVSPYGSYNYHHLDHYPSNFSLSSSFSQSEDHHHHNHYNGVLPSGPALTSQSYFPSHVATTAAAPMELDPRNFINHFQILNPTQHQSSLHMSLDDGNKK